MAEDSLNSREKSEIIRSLGGCETTYAHFVDTMGASILYQIGIVDSSCEISSDDIKEAAKKFASRQEVLRMRIVPSEPGSNLKFHFARMENWDEIELRLASLDSKDDWINIINEEQSRKFDYENGPLWGIILATVPKIEANYSFRYVIMLKMHHGICDAKSSFDALYRQFLPILSAVMNHGDPESIISEDIPLSKPCEEAFDNVHLPWYMKGGLTAYRWFNRTFRTSPEPCIFEYKEDPERTKEEILSDPGHYPFVFSPEVTSGVLKSAKQHGVTVHCVLLGVTSVALCATSVDAGINLQKNITQAWSIDVRKFLNWDFPQPLCPYVGVGMTTTKNKHDHSKEEFWKMCQDISKSVRSQSRKEKCIPGLGFSEYFINQASESLPALQIMNEFHFTTHSNVSNLGNCNIGPEPKMTAGEVEINLAESYFAVTTLRAMDNLAFFHCLSTLNGQIMWNLSYNPNRVSKRFVKNYMLKIQEICERFCSEEEDPS